MKVAKSIAVLAVIGSLAGCTTAEQTATGGALIGGAIGAATTGKIGGAAIGAFIGGVGGYLLGRSSNGQCRYQRPDGSVFIAACP
ncbi:hypothetical protein [Oricola indica]|jgi:hypothetical protein|uniref:hypothetical protein n=1 Tax=Oricola indica TaxID=2872591 RepID=UPI001CBBE939|nr:hypothetical protein [Oricola indica]